MLVELVIEQACNYIINVAARCRDNNGSRFLLPFLPVVERSPLRFSVSVERRWGEAVGPKASNSSNHNDGGPGRSTVADVKATVSFGVTGSIREEDTINDKNTLGFINWKAPGVEIFLRPR